MTNKTEKSESAQKTGAMTLCVFCGASPGKDPKHMALAESLGAEIARGGREEKYLSIGFGLDQLLDALVDSHVARGLEDLPS